MELRVDVLRETGWYGAESGCVEVEGAGMELRVDVLRWKGLVWS